MHADAAVTGISRTPATAERNTIQPVADVVNLTLKSKSGQASNHIEGRSAANVLQWSISALGAAALASLAVLGNTTTTTLIVGGLARIGGDISFGFDNVIRRDIVNGIMEITGGSAAADGGNLKLWGPSGSNGPDFALRHGAANVIFWDNSASMLYLEPAITATNLAGVGTRFVTVDATGLLGSATISGGGGVLGTGTANRVAYWSATDTITSSGNLTFNGSTLALTGAATISSTLGVTGAFTGTSGAFSTTLGVTSTVTLTDLAGSGTRLVQASSTGVLSTTTAAAFGLASGTGTNTQVALWSGTATLNGSANLTFNGTTLVLTGAQTVSSTLGVTGAFTGTSGAFSTTLGVTSTVTLTTLAGTGNRLVQASSTGILSATLTVPASFVDGTGTANRVAYWSSTTVITSSGNLTFNGTTLALTGDATISSTLGVTGALTVTSTSRLDGNVAVGGATNTAISLLIRSTALAGGSQYGMQSQAIFTSAATTSGTSVYASVITAAASFTMATGYGVRIDAANKGAGSTITTLYGLYIDNQTQGGTNYAISTGTGQVLLGDTVGIGSTSPTGTVFRIDTPGTALTNTSQNGMVSLATFTSAATNLQRAGYFKVNAAAGSYTTTNVYGIYIDTPTLGASHTVTNLYGLFVNDQTGGTTNMSIRTGTGINWFADSTYVQTATPGSTKNIAFQVAISNMSGSVNQYGIVSQSTFQSSATTSGNAIYATVATAASAFTMASARGIYIDDATLGAGSAITDQYGLYVESQTKGGNKWAIYTKSGIVRIGDFQIMDTTGVTQFLLNSAGANYGTIQNDAANTWSLGYKTTFTNALGTVALKWNSSGVITVPGTMAVTGAITATGGVVFNGGGTNLNYYLTGSFTGTFTSASSGTPTTTCYYTRIGNAVILTIGSVAGFGSLINSFTMTGLPAAITPTSNQEVAAPEYSFLNGGSLYPHVTINVKSTSILEFIADGNTNGWSAAGGNRGISFLVTIAYQIV